MNITKRILSTLLATVMVLSTFVGVFTIQVSADETTTQPVTTTPIANYVTQVYNNPEAKLQTMELMRTEGNYQLWVDKQSGEIAWVEADVYGNPTENILFSNPYDVASSKGSKTTKQELLSQIIVSFTDTTGTTKQLYSYTDAALNDQITVRLIKGGVRVEYIIGREDGRKLIPKWIFDDSFQTNILDNIQKAVKEGNLPKDEDRWFVNAWEKYDLNDSKITSGMRLELIKRYPALGENAFQNDKGKTEYPVLWVWLPKMSNASDTLKREAYIKTYCPDYTFEQLDADHEATGYVAEDEKYPVFKMALEYYLDSENGLTVRMPCNGLRYDAATYTLQNLTILPYMGASNYKNAGVTYETTDENGLPISQTTDSYTFFPDGSGALFNHAELGNSTEKLLGYVYGEDFAYHQLIGLKFHKAVRYPVYGVVSNELFYEYTYKEYDNETEEYISTTERISCAIKTKEQITKELDEKQAILEGDITIDSYTRGYAAFVEEADSLTRLQLYHGGALHNYSTIFPYFNPKSSDTYNLSGSIADSAESIGIKSDRKYTGSFTLHYVMLIDDGVATERKSLDTTYKYYNTSWLGMAEAYRDYLTRTGKLNDALTADDVKEDIPLYIEAFGALKTQETIATIPVWVMTPLTTFDNILTMYTELSNSDRNVKNINFKLTGFANGGMYSTMPYNLNWEENVGGADGFQELIVAARKINAKVDGSHLGLYPDFDFAYVQTDASFDGMTLKKDAVKTLDNRYTSYRYYDASIQNFVGFYKLAISPSRYSYFYEELISNYKKYGLSSMSVGSLGNALNSDFDEDDPYNREQSKEQTQQALSDIKNKGYSLMTDGGNVYTWAYVDHILNVELDSSRYLISSATVPFIGSVLHGYVQFAGAPLNEEGDVNYAILRAIENGAGLYFILSYQNTTELKEDKLLSEYYSIRYDIWLEDVAKHYNKLNTVLKDVQTKVIIDHEFLVGDRVLDLDELEADIENRLEGAVNDQNKVQNDLTTSEAVAVAEAWNMLYNANTIMQEMLNKVEEINAGLEKRYGVSNKGEVVFYDPTASDKERPKTNLADFAEVLNAPALNLKDPIPGTGSGVIPRYIYMQRVNDDVYYTNAIKIVKTQFEKLRDSAVYFAQSTADLQVLLAKAQAMEAEMQAAYDLINTTSIYDGKEEIRQALLKDAATWVSGVSAAAQEIETNAKIYLEGTDTDFLNKESDCYYLTKMQKNIDFYFNRQFAEGGEYYEYYKEGGQYYTDYNGEKVNAEQYPVDLVKIQRDLKSACPAVFFDEENIWAQVQGSDDETEDENSKSNAVNNNHIVVVTYGDRDTDTFEKTPYKSIILNYNSYAVRVTYNNTIYTVPSGGYIVIDYD